MATATRDIEILSLRHQLAVLQRQLGGQRVRFEPVDRRGWPRCCTRCRGRPCGAYGCWPSPDTILKWHRDLIARRHATLSRPRRRGRPRTLRSIQAWCCARPGSLVGQAARNLVMDLEGTGGKVKYLIRDRDGKYPALFDAILADAGVKVVLSGVQVPRMNAIIKRWVRTCRRELLDRTLIWNHRHLLHALREYEWFYNPHRPHQGIANLRPLKPLPEPITDPNQLARLNIHRRDRLGGVLHEYEHAA
ncbi:integrase core domain-containing protein [Micromonospora sp. SL1-18]|uniref:integrase core domain-containing protein n=1 Tax=Micromonospora sp. SL1-18 TaxID=3399128 RepID=UPI003A4D61FC